MLLCSRDASCLASTNSRDPPARGLGPDSVTYEHVSSKQRRAALLVARVSVSQLSQGNPNTWEAPGGHGMAHSKSTVGGTIRLLV